MRQLHVRNLPDEVVARLKQQAVRHGRSMEAEHRLILEHALFPERRRGRPLLEVLQAGPFAEPDFAPERARHRSLSGFLLDTSFLSVLGNPGRPSYGPAVHWYQSNDERDLFTCAVVIGEIARGITRLRPGRRREHYRHWLRHEVLPAFGQRVLPFDVRAALQWGAFMGDGERAGTVPSNDDAKIAAVASVHGLTVVTANERDFAPLGVPTVNPLR